MVQLEVELPNVQHEALGVQISPVAAKANVDVCAYRNRVPSNAEIANAESAMSRRPFHLGESRIETKKAECMARVWEQAGARRIRHSRILGVASSKFHTTRRATGLETSNLAAKIGVSKRIWKHHERGMRIYAEQSCVLLTITREFGQTLKV